MRSCACCKHVIQRRCDSKVKAGLTDVGRHSGVFYPFTCINSSTKISIFELSPCGTFGQPCLSVLRRGLTFEEQQTCRCSGGPCKNMKARSRQMRPQSWATIVLKALPRFQTAGFDGGKIIQTGNLRSVANSAGVIVSRPVCQLSFGQFNLRGLRGNAAN